MILKFKFVDSVPNSLEFGTLYISMKYSTAIHLCICGCNNEVVTPFNTTSRGWTFIYNGESVSLYPSIGNWSFECQSHYWIKNNKVIIIPEKKEKIKITKAKK